ncbi:hypothetical protein D3C85_60380 [compost metagenome]
MQLTYCGELDRMGHGESAKCGEIYYGPPLYQCRKCAIKYLAAALAENERFDEGMRAIACQLGAGGYNAPELTAEQLLAKVCDGLNTFTESTGSLLDQVRSERDQLNAEVARWKSIAANQADISDAAKEVLQECRVERDELRKDADRLSFIESEWFCAYSVGNLEFRFNEMWETPGDSLRSAIDAAMSKEVVQ